MIEGESGTGKELVARRSTRIARAKASRLCRSISPALPGSILESELFGHEQGAFTGAMGRRIGKFEYAIGGTLFLDEVGEMPMQTQIKLLRVLEDRKITRVGSNEEHDVNVRLVAATNANLQSMVDKKLFRSDLYYRLKVVSIYLPPLRERRGDIPLLIEHFRKELSTRMRKEVIGFSKTARQALLSYDWPGNIRELRNAVERMIVLDSDSQLDVDDLPEEIAVLARRDGDSAGPPTAPGSDSLIGRPLLDVEKYYIQRALELTEGKREEAAQLLGIGERTLYRKIKEYGLKNY